MDTGAVQPVCVFNYFDLIPANKKVKFYSTLKIKRTFWIFGTFSCYTAAGDLFTTSQGHIGDFPSHEFGPDSPHSELTVFRF